MDILTDQKLLERVERFIAENDIKPSRFGREAMGDGSLIQHMRAGRSLSLANANKLLAFMAAYTPPAVAPAPAEPAQQAAA